MADGIEARARRLKQLKRDLGVPLVKPRKLKVNFLSHELDPLPQGCALEDEPNPDQFLNIICIPTGLHFPPDGSTRWHPTGETYDTEIDDEPVTLPCSRQVPNWMTTEAGAANVTPKPSRVDAPLATGGRPKADEPVQPDVTAEEIAMARAEAKAMKVAARGDPYDLTTPEERRIWGDVASRRTDRRIDTSWLWGTGGTRVVRSQVMPEGPVKE